MASVIYPAGTFPHDFHIIVDQWICSKAPAIDFRQAET